MAHTTIYPETWNALHQLLCTNPDTPFVDKQRLRDACRTAWQQTRTLYARDLVNKPKNGQVPRAYWPKLLEAEVVNGMHDTLLKEYTQKHGQLASDGFSLDSICDIVHQLGQQGAINVPLQQQP